MEWRRGEEMDKLHIDDAIDFLVRYFAARSAAPGTSPLQAIQCARQYDVEIQYVADAYWRPKGFSVLQVSMNESEPLSRPFSDAAWHLCRIGVLRPGEKAPHAGMRGPGWDGGGFSLTLFGQEWIANAAATRPPIEPGRFGEVMRPYATRFGAGFLQRAVEASGCYRTGNYLACCAMTGAAAESVLLAIAIAKEGDEKRVINDYRGASGRRNIIHRVIRGVGSGLSQQFLTGISTLSFWRDETTHGIHTSISEVEAFMSLGQLLRLAQLASDNWQALTN
jgi:hypothetical protein